MRSVLVREARIVAPLGVPEHLGDALPVGLVGAADVDPAVARVERLVRRGEDVRGAGRARATRRSAKKIAACQ